MGSCLPAQSALSCGHRAVFGGAGELEAFREELGNEGEASLLSISCSDPLGSVFPTFSPLGVLCFSLLSLSLERPSASTAAQHSAVPMNYGGAWDADLCLER